MPILLIRLIALALLIYIIVLIVRQLRGIQRDAQSSPRDNAAPRPLEAPYGDTRDDRLVDIHDDDVLLTGLVRVQVVNARTAKPVAGRQVSLRACGFT